MLQITFTVNNEVRSCWVQPGEMLLDTLRSLGYNGVKRGCDEGTCGSCVVIVNGKLVNSCIVFSASTDGAQITTIEGVGDVDNPHPLQSEFVNAGAVQCGFCTPGMILATKVLLDRNPVPTDDDIKSALDGNLCRCTGYVKIIDAVHNAARVIREKSAAGKEVTNA